MRQVSRRSSGAPPSGAPLRPVAVGRDPARPGWPVRLQELRGQPVPHQRQRLAICPPQSLQAEHAVPLLALQRGSDLPARRSDAEAQYVGLRLPVRRGQIVVQAGELEGAPYLAEFPTTWVPTPRLRTSRPWSTRRAIACRTVGRLARTPPPDPPRCSAATRPAAHRPGSPPRVAAPTARATAYGCSDRPGPGRCSCAHPEASTRFRRPTTRI